MKYPDLNSNLIEEIAVLENTTVLTELHLRDNLITDLTPLLLSAERGGLGQGDEVWLSGNPLSAVAEGEQLSRLRDEYGVTVYFP